MMQLSELLMRRGIWLDLEWVPREKSTIADRLANLELAGFDPALRLDVDVSANQFPLMHELLDAEVSFRHEMLVKKREKLAGPAPTLTPIKRRKVQTLWG